MTLRSVICALLSMALVAAAATPGHHHSSAADAASAWCADSPPPAETLASLEAVLALVGGDEEAPTPFECPDCTVGACCAGAARADVHASMAAAWTVQTVSWLADQCTDMSRLPRGPPLGGRGPPLRQSI